MNIFIYKISRIFLIAIIFILSSCSGRDDTSVPSPFAGHWVGTSSNTFAGYSGTFDITISLSGQVTGTVQNLSYAPPPVTPMTGSIDNNGKVTFDYTYLGNTFIEFGSLAISENGHLAGTTNLITSRNVYFGSPIVDLIKQ